MVRRGLWANTTAASPTLAAFGAMVLAAGLPTGCGSGRRATGPTAPASLPFSLRLETAHFRLFADAVPDAVLRDVAERLEAELPRYQADLAVGAVRPFTVRIYQDPVAWRAEVERFFGRSIDTSGYVTSADELRVRAVTELARNATHELAHCVSLYVNPTFANNPRWLWESVALYENRELVDPRTLDYMVAGHPPSLAELDADVAASHRVYEVGYTVGEFVVAFGGPKALVDLVRANGDTGSVLGLTAAEFETRWYAFVQERYLP